MTKPRFDQDFWEQLWSKTLREHADKVARRPPNAHLMAEAAGADTAERIDWIEGDLATWTAEPGRYDLVVCLYVHVAGSVEDMVRRMANGVAPVKSRCVPRVSHFSGSADPRLPRSFH
ncbi:MAG TPA: class I SAM-dependent methyltransferase [Thermoanaerobaculia bacterium]|nr:class I SAM-dependent methyltransferase [Thermoanaerobaculia bacterium]